MPEIKQLSPHVADLIAAGEVVERPASVVKELVENAIDAGAGAVTVEIEHGGMTLIRVTDNGCGIPAREAATAFLRHATSKISTEYDLEAIGTLGFRGEALAAISAVSRIDLLTKTADAPLGCALTLEGGRVVEQEEAGCPDGTTMVVRDLFYNTPARLKFTKKDAAEGAAVFAAVQRLALSHPELSVKFIRDGRQELLTPGDGQLKSAVYSVLGRDLALGFTEARGSGEDMSVSGFVSIPACCRGSRSYQHFFVNGRYVKNRTMMAALEEAYQNQKMVGRFPGCVLHLTVRPNRVDVNVHPAKTEVKFQDERQVFSTVYHAVLSALTADRTRPAAVLTRPKPQDTVTPNQTSLLFRDSAGAAVPTPGFVPPAGRVPGAVSGAVPAPSAGAERTQMSAPASTAASAPSNGAPVWAPAARPDAVREPSSFRRVEPIPAPASTPSPAFPADDRPGAAPQTEGPVRPAFSAQAGTDSLGSAAGAPSAPVVSGPSAASTGYMNAAPGEPADNQAIPAGQGKPAPAPDAPSPTPEEPWMVRGELFRTYVMVEQGDKVLLIDKHAAHERANFDRLRAQDYRPMVQQLLSPVTFTPAPEEREILLGQLELLARFGFEVEEFGSAALIVRALPSDMDAGQAQDALLELAGRIRTTGAADPAAARDELLHTMACKAAIKGGQKNGPAELEEVARLVLSGQVKYCPHGRPVAIELTRAQLEKQFRRA